MPPTCTPSTEIDPYQFDLDLLDADTGETLPPPTTTSDLEIEHISAFLTTIPRPLLNLASVPSGYFRGYSDEHGFRFKIETEQEVCLPHPPPPFPPAEKQALMMWIGRI